MARWISPVVLILAWEAASRLGLIPARVLTAPSAVLGAAWTLLVSGDLIRNLAVSLARAGIGAALGVLIGGSLALVAGLSRKGELAVDGPAQMLRTLPPLALTPLFLVWFGIGETVKIALIVFATTFPVYINLYAGIRSVDPKLVEAARSLGMSTRQIVWDVVLPGALPSLFTGLRYAFTFAVMVLVVAEQINAQSGLGYLIGNARDFMQTDVIVVCLLIYAFLGLGADALVRALERRTLAWRPAFVEP